MDGVVAPQTAADGGELLEHVQSATQSQQFKTLDDSKAQLVDAGPEAGTSKNLNASQSDKLGNQPEAGSPIDT